MLPSAVRGAGAAAAARRALPRPRPGAAALSGRDADSQRDLFTETCMSASPILCKYNFSSYYVLVETKYFYVVVQN